MTRDLATLYVSLALAVTACGGDPNNLPDAPPGTPDAMRPPDAQPGTATVHVSQEDFDPDPGTAIENAKVQVIAPGGATADYLTDATGTSIFPVEMGSRVWVVRDGIPNVLPTIVPGGVSIGAGQIYLIEAVDAGDDITLGAQPPQALLTAGTFTVNYTPYGGGTYGFAHDSYFSPCIDGGVETVPGTIVFTVYDYQPCASPQRELTITASDLASGLPVAWLRVPNVGLTAGATIDATAATWDTVGTAYTVNYANFDAAVYSGYTYVAANASWHQVYLSASIAGTGTSTTTDVTLPAPALALTQLYHNTASPQWVADPLATLPASYDLDGGALLPFISWPNFDPATRTITWTEDTAGTVAPQLVTASFSNYDSVDLTSYRWTIYAPGTTTTFVIPDVPNTLTTHDLDPTVFVYPDLWYLNVAGSSYGNLLTDVDLYRNDPPYSSYRPTTRDLLSGGYGGGKGVRAGHRR